MKIIFLSGHIECEYQEGERLLEIAARSGIYMDASCGGKGTCKKCQVSVTDEAGHTEIQLACQYYPKGDLRITLANLLDASKRKEQLLLLLKDFRCTAASRRFTEGFGLAFDIGTTTVVGALWDYDKNKSADISAEANPQSCYGADVISCILYASESAGNL